MLAKITRMLGGGFVLLLVVGLLSTTSPLLAAPAAQTVSFSLCAGEGMVTMPDSAVIDFWGFGYIGTDSLCHPQLPGPVLDGINPGDTVQITLWNDMAVPTAMLFPGQTGMDVSGTTSPGLFVDEVGPGDTATYSFTAGPAGTYLYESGRANEPQVAMGLYGALIVGAPQPVEKVLVLSEIDPDLNANPTGFDLFNYNPTYWLLNGRAYPDTLDPDDAASTQPYSSLIEVNSGDVVRVRYVNAGAIHHTMSLLGLRQAVVANEAYANPNAPVIVAQTIPSGETADVNIAIPLAATINNQYPLFNRQLHLTNGSPGAGHSLPGGGMLTFIDVTGIGTGPVEANLAVSKSDDADPVTAGDNVTYIVTVTNNGPATADAVTLTDTLPADVIFVSATPSVGACNETTGTVTCDLGSITNGGSANVTIVVTTTTDGLLTNSAQVSATTTDPNPGDNSVNEDTSVEAVVVPANTMHVGSLAGSTFGFGNNGRFVAVTIHDSSEAPVDNATVSGTWTGGFLGSSTCTTSLTPPLGLPPGSCFVTRYVGTVTFTVNNVTHSSLTYNAPANEVGDPATITGPPF